MINHKLYPKNESGRDFVLSDLHGMLNLLQDTLEQLEFNKETDRMFSVGDLIDRGPSSIECLRLSKESWFIPVLGNHEQFLIDTILNERPKDLWIMNGGGWFEDEDAQEVDELAQHVFGSFPYAITVETSHGNVGICHAQPPSSDWSDVENPSADNIHEMLWGRSWIKSSGVEVKGVWRTIHGHTPVRIPTGLYNVYFIDTGAFYTGELAVMEIQSPPNVD